MNKLITVFTPLYNRKALLPRLYESLTKQTCRSFEWLIVDDGSSDGSYELAMELAAQENRFPVRVVRAPRNGGKHRAVNIGAPLAEGFLFFIVDSDDALTPDAIEKIFVWEETIRDKQGFAGLGFLKADLASKPVGTTFPEHTCDCTSLEREEHNISGDKAEVYYTAVIQNYPYPEFEGERYLTPAVVWDRIAHAGLKLRWINEIIYLCEYQPDGLTANWNKLCGNNPKGYALWLRQKMDFKPYTGYDRFYLVYGYYYTINLTRSCTMKYACEQLDYPYWKACFYMPIRKGLRIWGRFRALLGGGKEE
ncbi:MAG: glycosyltransferase family 2 protein [Oscillospiraceae bacterium]|nr:glycosyltransferase family 2 protein [Oscillospiraceae bacterium]